MANRGTERIERPCTVVVSGYSGSDGSGVTIRVEDKSSRTIMLEVRLTHEQWGRASMAQHAEALYSAGDQKYWGSVAENTTTEVTLSEAVVTRIRNSDQRETILRTADKGAHQMFLDGWHPRWGDIGNMHTVVRRNRAGDLIGGDTTYRVVWFRQVDAVTGEPIR